ncbi:hypothetical protein ACHAO1_008478 [Botrytis cinerea]
MNTNVSDLRKMEMFKNLDIYSETNEDPFAPSSFTLTTIRSRFLPHILSWLPFYLLLFVICYELRRVIKIFYNQRPSNVKIAGAPTLLGNWITSIRYCYASQEVHNEAYAKGGGAPYAIPTRRRYQVCVSSQKLVEELGSASIHDVSLRDALWERAFPEQTINGLKLNNMDKNGGLSQKVFRHHARLHLPGLQPLMEKRVRDTIKGEIGGRKTNQGKYKIIQCIYVIQLEESRLIKLEWTHVSASRVLGRIVTKINNIIIVGDDLGTLMTPYIVSETYFILASNPVFFENVVTYLNFAGVCEEILQFTPQLFHPLVGWIIMKGTRVTQRVNGDLVALAQKRLEMNDAGEPKDTIQWIISCQRKASAKNVAQQALSYIFGSAYQMPMLLTFAMYNLCKHPEYLEPLRQEVLASGGVQFNHQNHNLPLLDSFLKETGRMNPVTIFGMPRKVMSAFTFSDGTHVPAHNWVVVPQQAQMKDPANYIDPENFKGFRFVKEDKSKKSVSESRFSHPSWRFPFWGSVKQACPARFYVTDMTKLIFTEIIMKYDLKLADENVPNSFAWGVLRIPHPRLAFLMRERST